MKYILGIIVILLMSLTLDASILFKVNSDEVTYKTADGEMVIKAPKEEKTTPTAKDDGWWSPQNAMTICASVLIFGVFVLIVTSYIGSREHGGEELNKFNLMVLVIIAAIFLVTAGYTETQITPVVGLLSTIVGYVLGKGKK